MQVKPVIAAHDFDLHVVNYSARNKLCSSLSHELPMWGQYIEALYDTKKHSQASKTGRKKKKEKACELCYLKPVQILVATRV